MPQKITMKEIAKRLGIAESSVSRALNHKEGVSQDLREKVLALAAKMHYRPNALAQGLALHESKNLGLLIPNLESSFYGRVFKGIQGVANRRGYRIILGTTDGDEKIEHYYMNLFYCMQVDGLMVMGEELVSQEVIRVALGHRPLILINCYLEELMVPSLLLDHQAGIYKVVEELLSRDLGPILFMNGPDEDFLSQDLYGGFSQAHRDLGLDPWVVNSPLSREGGYHTICSLLKKGHVPSSLVVINELVAIGAMDALQRGGLFIPEDVSVVAYGDSIISKVSSPTMTTVKEPAATMGQKAMEMMLQLVKGRTGPFEMEIMEGELVFRGSLPKK